MSSRDPDFRRWALLSPSQDDGRQRYVERTRLQDATAVAPPAAASTTHPAATAATAALHALSIQKQELKTLQEALSRERSEKEALRQALAEAEARARNLTPRKGSPKPPAQPKVPSWQLAEALALELDVLNWSLGEGQPFQRRAFWGQALPCAVAMLRACGEASELGSIGSAVWRPAWQAAGGQPAPVPALRDALRRDRDRVNQRLDRLHTTVLSASGGGGGGGGGSGGVPSPAVGGNVAQRRDWLRSLTPQLPPLPLSLALHARGSGSGGRVCLAAPAGAPLVCVNDTKESVLLRWDDEAPGAATVLESGYGGGGGSGGISGRDGPRRGRTVALAPSAEHSMPSPKATPSSSSPPPSSSSAPAAAPSTTAASADHPDGGDEEAKVAQPPPAAASGVASSRFSVLLDGGQGWIQVVVYREPCDGLSQRGQPCDAHPLGSPHAGGAGAGGAGGRTQHRSGRTSPAGGTGGGGSGGASRSARRALTPTFERSAPIAEADEAAGGWGVDETAAAAAAAGGAPAERPSVAEERVVPASHAPLRRRSVLALDSYLRSVAQPPPHAGPLHAAPTATLSAAPFSPCARSPLADGTSAACTASWCACACAAGGASSPSACSVASDATPPATPPRDVSTPSPTQCVTPSSVSARTAEAKFVRAAHSLSTDGWEALANATGSHRRAREVLEKVGVMVAALGEAADEQAAVSAAREEASEAALSLLGRLPPKLHQSLAEGMSAGRHGGASGDGTKAGAVVAQMAHAPPGGVAAGSLESYAHVLLHEAACSVASAPASQRPRELRRLQSPRLTAVLSLLRAASAASRVRRAALEAAVRRLERAIDAVRALGKLPPPSPGNSRPGSATATTTAATSPASSLHGSRPSSALAYMSSSSAMGSPTSSPVPPRRLCAGTASPLCAGTAAPDAAAPDAAAAVAATAASAPSPSASHSTGGSSSPLHDAASSASTTLAGSADAGTTQLLSQLQQRIEAQQQQLEEERERLRARRRSRHSQSLAGGGGSGGGGGASPSPPPLTSSPPQPARRTTASLSSSSSAAGAIPVARPPAHPPTTALCKTLDTLQATRLLDHVQEQPPDDMLARVELELD